MYDTAPTLLNLISPEGLRLSLMDQGATWLSCQLPLPDGSHREVLLGCPNPKAYAQQTTYMGATIGRYANRIGHSRISHAGQTWPVTPSAGSQHQLHGGPEGFDKRRWNIASASSTEVCFTLESADGDQGFPGAMQVQVVVRLVEGLGIDMEFEARVSAPSPVCLTNHSYFNLDATHLDARQHGLAIASDQYLPVDGDLIPLGHLAPVQDTGFDFRRSKTPAQDWLQDAQQAASAGYDHAFLLNPACAQMQVPAAVLQSSDKRLAMRIHTTLPSLQMYTGQYLGGVPTREGGHYAACAGIALEPQFLPDSPNHPEWPQPSCWLQPGQVYRHSIHYRFSVS
jgi:aldose 1-epimerase